MHSTFEGRACCIDAVSRECTISILGPVSSEENALQRHATSHELVALFPSASGHSLERMSMRDVLSNLARPYFADVRFASCPCHPRSERLRGNHRKGLRK